MLQRGDKIGIVCCSNAQRFSYQAKIDQLLEEITELGLVPVCSNCIYEKYDVFGGTAIERASELNRFYEDPEIKAIFDISGGDVANELLEYIDYEAIRCNPKPIFGYSDLTTILNAIYTITGETTFLYQLRNLIYTHKECQKEWFANTLLGGKQDLLQFRYRFLQGDRMEGELIGGNLRCLLKLAGTPYMPDFKNKILLLESYSGGPAVITTLLYQLKHMGAFSKVNGILLGTFTQMDKEQCEPDTAKILMDLLGENKLPIAVTKEIGHGTDSKGIAIGRYLKFK